MKATVFCILMSSVAILISACASMTPEKCPNANWETIGFNDALAGEQSKLLEHIQVCNNVSVTPNATLYNKGYQAGIRQFCTRENGIKLGKNGGPTNICDQTPSAMEFYKGYTEGAVAYRKQQDINKYSRPTYIHHDHKDKEEHKHKSPPPKNFEELKKDLDQKQNQLTPQEQKQDKDEIQSSPRDKAAEDALNAARDYFREQR